MSGNPYQPPVEESPPDHRIRPEVGRGQAIASLVLLMLGTLVSSIVMAMLNRAFEGLASTGSADPQLLASSISQVIGITLLGMACTLVGGVLAAISLYGRGNRERWFHVIGMFVFLLQLGTLPLGTPIGILLLFGGFLRWKEFHPPSPRPENPPR